VITLLQVVMESNIIQFGDTYWLQIIGTEMGTPYAVIFAVICILTTERHILAKYSDRLAYFKRYIDDIHSLSLFLSLLFYILYFYIFSSQKEFSWGHNSKRKYAKSKYPPHCISKH
jgi:hypothetical protein